MTVPMSKKNFEKFVVGILTLDLEHDVHKFMLDDLNRMAAKAGMYETWEQRRAIEAATTLGVLRMDGAFYLTNLKVAEAIKMFEQFGGEFIDKKETLEDKKE